MAEDRIWPETPFEESMIGSGVIIHCPDKDLAEELFDILRDNGVNWWAGESMDDTLWNGEYACYHIMASRYMKRGDVYYYNGSEYNNYIKCTFYGTEPDIEISDASFEGIISI